MDFPEGFPLFKLISFFLKLKSILIQQKLIFNMSNLNARELDLATNLRQFDANCGKI